MPKLKAFLKILVKEPAAYLFLIIIVCVGLNSLFMNPLKAPATGSIPGYDYPLKNRILSSDDIRLIKKPNENDLEFATRVNKELFEAAWHCNIHKPELSAPNPFLIKTVRALYPAFNKSIKSNGIIMLDHGFYFCGLCHQQAQILASILLSNGIKAEPWGIIGHVVLKASINDKIYFFDPDFGIGPILQEDSKDFYSNVEALYLKIGVDSDLAKNTAERFSRKENHLPYKGKDAQYWDEVILEPQKKGLYLARLLQRLPSAILVLAVFLLLIRIFKLMKRP